MKGKILLRFLLVMIVLMGSLWSIKKEPMKFWFFILRLLNFDRG